MMEFLEIPNGMGSFTYVDVNLRNVVQVRIVREPDRFRFDMIDNKGVTTHVLTFPDVKRDERDRRIKELEERLEAIREAGGWYLDRGDYGDDD